MPVEHTLNISSPLIREDFCRGRCRYLLTCRRDTQKGHSDNRSIDSLCGPGYDAANEADHTPREEKPSPSDRVGERTW